MLEIMPSEDLGLLACASGTMTHYKHYINTGLCYGWYPQFWQSSMSKTLYNVRNKDQVSVSSQQDSLNIEYFSLTTNTPDNKNRYKAVSDTQAEIHTKLILSRATDARIRQNMTVGYWDARELKQVFIAQQALTACNKYSVPFQCLNSNIVYHFNVLICVPF